MTQDYLKIGAFVALALCAANAAYAEGGGQGQALDPSQLDAISAGHAPQIQAVTEQSVDAVNHDNSISAGTVQSGQVNFSAGAFSGFNGVGNVVVNTGNNNNIQGTLSVTVISAAAH